MHKIRRARGLAAALLFSIAGTSCRESAAPSGPGRLAPTHASLALISALPEESGAPLIPLRSARVRLFRLPGEVPERAVVDTVVPFTETDPDLSLTFGIVVTMASERFGLELTLIDDQQQVVYRARDTVVAYSTGEAPPPKAVVLRYVGADTAVARIVLSTADGVIPVGEPTPLRASAFLRDGRPTSARFGYAVHGTPSITIDGDGILRATAPVAPGTAWIVARLATGLADSIEAEAIVPAASVSLSASNARLDVGGRLTLGAVVRDAGGAVLQGRRPLWTSSDAGVATVVDGVVTGRSRGTATITARSGHASAEATVDVVLPDARAARVVITPHAATLLLGDQIALGATVFDAAGAVMRGRTVAWRSLDPSVAIVDGAGLVRTVGGGSTSVVASVDAVADTIAVVSRQRSTLSITQTATTIDSRGEIATFLVSSFDQHGQVIDNPNAQWSVTSGATLLSASGPTVQLLFGEKASAVLTAKAYGLRADLPVASTRSTPPTSAPVTPLAPPAAPATPPKRG